MVMAIIEPIAAGVIVSLLNKYVLSGQFYNWIQSACQHVEEETEEEQDEHDVVQWSSTTTVMGDIAAHMYSH